MLTGSDRPSCEDMKVRTCWYSGRASSLSSTAGKPRMNTNYRTFKLRYSLFQCAHSDLNKWLIWVRLDHYIWIRFEQSLYRSLYMKSIRISYIRSVRITMYEFDQDHFIWIRLWFCIFVVKYKQNAFYSTLSRI